MMLFRKCIRSVRAMALATAVIGFASLWQSETTQAQVSIGISVNFAPPALPVYEQPLCPGDGYIWTPGYWAWDPDYGDYYWVPGTWVLAPQRGYLWTPPYWGWNGVAFLFHEGYWGPRIGFYGGINYGYGYPGRGYYGGRWERDRFYYNRNVNNINVTQIHNVYNKTVINNVNVTRVSYNGGNGGVRERANRQEESAFRERHVAAVAAQQQHIQEARSDRALRASDNRGKPPIAATDRPGQFRGGNVVAAREGKYDPPANRGGGNRPENNVNRAPEPNRPDNRPDTRNDRNDRPPNARGPENNNNRPTYVHPKDMPKTNRPDRPPSSGNVKADQKYNQRSDNMYKKQDQERQNLEKKQEQQHAQAEQQRANDARRQQMEKQHQQQTQKMEQRQQQQEQKMQRQAPKPKAQPQPKQQSPKQQGEKPHGKGR